MEIRGFLEVSLLEYPGKISSVVFVPGCDFRCPFCFNRELVLNDKSLPKVDEEKVFRYLIKKKGWVDAVCVTGGEPTLQKDLHKFLEKVKELGFLTALSTNGARPDVLSRLIKQRLVDRVMMDIKTSKQRYREAAGVKVDIQKIQESIDTIKNSGIDYEFRMTVVPLLHKKEDLMAIGIWLKGAKIFVLQQFRPQKTLDVSYQKVRPYTEEELTMMANALRPYFEDVIVRNV